MKLDSLRQRLSQGSVIRTYAGNFSESGFWEKLKSVSRKLGSKVTYMLLVLYYSIGEVPLKDKMLILGVLGDFIRLCPMFCREALPMTLPPLPLCSAQCVKACLRWLKYAPEAK